MPELELNCIPDINKLAVQLSKQLDKPLLVTWGEATEKRSLSMNALSHMWYQAIGDQTGQSALEVKRECKYLFGVPMLRAKSESFDFLISSLEASLSYEQMLVAMDEIRVTSAFTKKQMAKYLMQIQRTQAESGVDLRSSGELLHYSQKLVKESMERDQ